MDRNHNIVQSQSATNLIYLFQYDQMFSQTGYKVLQSQTDNGFIKCARILHNGKTELIYDVSGFETLSSLLAKLNPEIFQVVFANLVSMIQEVKNNGFMQYDNIETSFHKIYLDCNSYKVYFIYLPVEEQSFKNDFVSFEDKFRKNIIAAIDENANLVDPAVLKIRNSLSAGFSMETVVEGMKKKGQNTQLNPPADSPKCPDSAPQRVKKRIPKQKKRVSFRPILITMIQLIAVALIVCVYFLSSFSFLIQIIIDAVVLVLDILAVILILHKPKSRKRSVPVNTVFQTKCQGGPTELLDSIFVPSLMLCGLKTPQKVEVLIDKPEFIIGKNPESVDGVVAFNKAISRVQCKFLYEDSQYYLVDLGSLNGTFLNGARLTANVKAPVKNGDKIRMANSDFFLKTV